MSLDVYLVSENKVIRKAGTGIYVREDGQTRELSDWEVAEKFPNAEVKVVEDYETNVLFEANTTHNLAPMAKNVDLYEALWRPEEKGWYQAKDIIPKLEAGLKDLIENPHNAKRFNPENGWGKYENLVYFVEKYLEACRKFPDAKIEVSR